MMPESRFTVERNRAGCEPALVTREEQDAGGNLLKWPMPARPCARSIWLEAGFADHLAPFFGFRRQKPAELVRRAAVRLTAQAGEPRFDRGIGQRRIDLPIELVD